MKAIILETYGSPKNLTLKEVPQPKPKEGEVLVKTHATAVNDWDWSLVTGKPFYIRLLCGFLKPKIAIPGAEIAGIVESIGENVTAFQPGDRVYGDISECGFGAFAEYVAVPENAIAAMPPEMNFTDAAALPHAAMLAIQGLEDYLKLQPDHTLLINGAGGGVGVLGLKIAQTLGLKNITGVDHSDKLAMMQSIGFENVIDYTQEDYTRNGQQYDYILDTKTNRSLFHCIRALTPKGTFVTVGGSPARLLQTLFLCLLLPLFSKKRLRIVALKPNRDLKRINELYVSGKLRPIIDQPFTLAETPAALQRFGDSKHKGKIVITT